MATQKINLTRDQLATFLKNQEQIKQFEKLFAIVDEVAPSSDTTGISIQAGTAQATAEDALAQIIGLSRELALAPVNTLGTVTSVAALTLGTTGTDLSSAVNNSTTTPVITLQVPTASAVNRGALSAADWSTFNNKQPALSSMYVDQAFTSQTSITVTHSFGKYPVVNAIDNTGSVVVPLTIIHASVNAFTVTFSVATTGNIIAVIGF